MKKILLAAIIVAALAGFTPWRQYVGTGQPIPPPKNGTNVLGTGTSSTNCLGTGADATSCLGTGS